MKQDGWKCWDMLVWFVLLDHTDWLWVKLFATHTCCEMDALMSPKDLSIPSGLLGSFLKH